MWTPSLRSLAALAARWDHQPPPIKPRESEPVWTMTTTTTDGDVMMTCVICGEDFLFTPGEQQYFQQCGLQYMPRRCRLCRAERRQQNA